MSKNIVEITGFKELQRKITLLGNDKDKRRQMLIILRNVAKSTVKAAQSFAPASKKPHAARGGKIIQPGSLRKSIGNITSKSKTNPAIFVGPRVKGKHNAYYGAWVETGHNIYKKGFKRNRNGNAKKNAIGAKSKTEGVYYMKKAYQTTKGQVTADLEKNTAKFIQRRINKLSS